MDSLRIGFFYDSALRDHSCTLLGLEDAYRRARSTHSHFRADASKAPGEGAAALDLVDAFTVFDAISLDPEFCRHPVLRESQFLLDSTIDLMDFPWRGGELDGVGALPRVAALDVRAWSIYSTLFNRDIPLLPAPLPPMRATSQTQRRQVAIIVNDSVLASGVLDELGDAVRRAVPGVTIVELMNPYHSPMQQSDWLEVDLASAHVHVHIGFPPDAASFGRLIDTMNVRAPCIVFEGGQIPADADKPTLWRRPAYEHGTNMIRSETIRGFAEALRLIVRDRTWAQHLVRNGLREVEMFQEQIQNALLPNHFVDVGMMAAS